MERITLFDCFKNRTSKSKRWLGLLTFCSFIFAGQSVFAQTYCTVSAASNDATGLTNVTFNTLNNDSETTGAYTNYTNDNTLITYVTPGESYPLSVRVNTASTATSTYNVVVRAWIDWNNDGTFSTTTEQYELGSVLGGNDNPTSLTPNVLIPSNASGPYRMRIRAVYGATASPAPCGAQSWSEAEDYIIIAGTPPTCYFVNGLSSDAITHNSASFSWNAIGNAESYNWFLFADGANPETDTPLQNGTTTGLSVSISTGLTPLTEYTLYIQTNCGATDGLSEYIGIDFTTACLPPTITSTTPGETCGMGEITLAATADSGVISWFSSETGGSKLGEGTTFTTPLLTDTTSYWVSTKVGVDGTGGNLNPLATSGASTSNNWGIRFTVTEEVELTSVDVYSTANGTLNIKITDNNGVELYETGIQNIINGGTSTPNVIPLQFTAAPGDYRILIKSYTGANIIRDNTGVTFPYTSEDGIFIATASEWGGTTTANYYYFYNISYSQGCASPRTEVIATVTEAPELELSSENLLVCDGSNGTPITITSGASSYDTFTWSPSTGVSGDHILGWTFSSTEDTIYTLTSSNSVSGCMTVNTVSIITGQAPVFDLTEDVVVCAGDIVELNSGVNNFTAEFINEDFSTGTTFPEGWQTVIGAGDAIAIVNANTAGGEPNQLRITGNSQTVSVINRAFFGPINTSGLTELNLQWDNYVYHYSNSYVYSVKIQTSSDGTTWNDTDWVFSPVTATQAAAQVNTIISTSDVGSSTFYVSFTVEGRTFGMHNWNIDNVVLSGEVNHEIIWTPASNLYTDAEATIPYVEGSASSVVYFMGAAATNTFTASSTTSLGCTTSESVTVSIGDATPIGDSNQTVEAGSTLLDLEVTFSGTATWYSDAELTTVISDPSSTVLIDGATYYVTSSTEDCTSDALAITVTIDPCANTPLPNAESPQAMTVGQTVADIVVTGENLTFYSDEELTTVVDPTTVLEAGSYTFFVTQTIDNCISDAIEVVVEVTLSTNGFDMTSFKAYPNPVKDYFNVSYSKEITNVTVVNMLGQVILTKEVNAHDTQVDMSNLPSGNYLVRVNIDGAIQTVKVVKQ